MLSLTFQLSAVLPRMIREEASGATSHQKNKAHSLLDWHFLILEEWLTRVKNIRKSLQKLASYARCCSRKIWSLLTAFDENGAPTGKPTEISNTQRLCSGS